MTTLTSVLTVWFGEKIDFIASENKEYTSEEGLCVKPTKTVDEAKVTDYDCVILGTPVWAGTFAPPLRTLIRANAGKWREKKIAVFVCSGGGPGKTLDKLKTELGIPAFAASLSLIDPKARPSEENEKKIAAFCDALEKACK